MSEKELFGNSEQLETHDKRTETHACDLISRQAAIEALDKRFGSIPIEQTILLLRKDLRNLPSAQPSATDTNVATTDSISRAAVVDAIDGVDWYHQNQHGEMVHGANPDEHQAWYKADDIYAAIERVPSAVQNCDGCKWSDAIGYGECHHCKRAFEDMYEKGEQP